ncbi:hypothetical protein AB0J65_28260, partial [Streptomyces toxytricini]
MSGALSRRSAMRLLGALGAAGAALGAGGCGAALPPGATARTGTRTAPAPAAGGGAAAATGRPGSAARVEALLERLTLDEKTALLHGAPDPAGRAAAGHLPGVPRLGIPPLRFAECPAGVRGAGPATALPAPVV